MKSKNRGTGGGGKNTNINGLEFENQQFIKIWLRKSAYQLQKIKQSSTRSVLYAIYQKQNLIGYYGRQGSIYEALKLIDQKHFTNHYIKQVLSHKIYPDTFIMSINPRRLTIFEKKWQQCHGSVDEKIQTAPFKLAMFEKLLQGSNFQCMYQYILSSWFQNKKYRNVKEYYQTNKHIDIWVDGENLERLNIDDFLK